MSNQEALPGLEDDTPPATPFIHDLLRDALVAHERMSLPSAAESASCTTNAEVEALYKPWHADLYQFLFHASLAHVLIRVHEASPNQAAGIAREVREWLDAGDAYPEWVWEWAVDSGINPEDTIAAARAAHEKWLAEPRRTTNPASPK